MCVVQRQDHFTHHIITNEWQSLHRCTANHLLPSIPAGTRHRFMQNGDSSHTCHHTQIWLQQFAVPLLPHWPAHSPDLNAIEYIWNWMRMFVNKESPDSRPSLKRAIRLAWQQLPQAKIQSCVDHIPNMIRDVNAAGGTYVYHKQHSGAVIKQ
jgi:hypothetical protein